MPDPELLLVRHGRSAHVHTGWVDVEGVRRWMAAYDAAEIMLDHAPPAELEAMARDASLIIASDLPRTVASAIRLAPGREIVRTPLLREAPMETAERPLPGFGGIRLPLRAWGMLWGTRWLAPWLWNAQPPGIGPAEQQAIDARRQHLGLAGTRRRGEPDMRRRIARVRLLVDEPRQDRVSAAHGHTIRRGASTGRNRRTAHIRASAWP